MASQTKDKREWEQRSISPRVSEMNVHARWSAQFEHPNGSETEEDWLSSKSWEQICGSRNSFRETYSAQSSYEVEESRQQQR